MPGSIMCTRSPNSAIAAAAQAPAIPPPAIMTSLVTTGFYLEQRSIQNKRRGGLAAVFGKYSGRQNPLLLQEGISPAENSCHRPPLHLNRKGDIIPRILGGFSNDPIRL